jgi:hypothetical protein
MTEITIPQDPALAAAVLEIENHIAEAGWDQPARLYALVDTARIVAQEPDLAAQMGLDSASEDGSFTPVEQDALPAERFAREHPLRQEVRIVAGATRAGATYCALRLRAHDDDQSVVDGTELVPGLLDLLRSTLEGDTQ